MSLPPAESWTTENEAIVRNVYPLDDSETLFLVGSIAEGLSNNDSDIDLCLVTTAPPAPSDRRSAELLRSLQLSHDRRLDLSVCSEHVLRDIATRLRGYVDWLCSDRIAEPPPSVSEHEAHLVHRVRSGVPLANRAVAARLRAELPLDALVAFLVLQSLHKFFQYRQDVEAQLREHDELSARWMLGAATDALACAELASVGVTHIRSKWRAKLVARHRDALGADHATALLGLLVPDTNDSSRVLLTRLTKHAFATIDRIAARNPGLITACAKLLATNRLEQASTRPKGGDTVTATTTGIVSVQNRAPQSAATVGPFAANPDRTYRYSGNRIFEPVDKINTSHFLDALPNRFNQLAVDERWSRLAEVNGVVFSAATEYFEQLKACFMPLPLTTRMISSPGALYGKEKIDYTSDTAPVTLKWFSEEREIFLAESSQIYLELSLLQRNIDHVYSIYNSFRKEEGDETHLSEFHHIEYEGHVSAERNVQIAEGLVRHLLHALLSRAPEALAYFLWPHQLRKLEASAIAPTLFMRIPYEECMKILLKDTGDPKYQRFTMQDQWGRWEEVRITEILGSSVAISGFPLLEVPFYHCRDKNAEPARAMNTDFIWGGYAEIVGAGQRIGEIEELEEKAVTFNLPPLDYEPYLRSRSQPGFRRSSGFGLGWERFVQGVLRLPSITEACPFPRTHRGVAP